MYWGDVMFWDSLSCHILYVMSCHCDVRWCLRKSDFWFSTSNWCFCDIYIYIWFYSNFRISISISKYKLSLSFVLYTFILDIYIYSFGENSYYVEVKINKDHHITTKKSKNKSVYKIIKRTNLVRFGILFRWAE